jgi:hypothetical protein
VKAHDVLTRAGDDRQEALDEFGLLNTTASVPSENGRLNPRGWQLPPETQCPAKSKVGVGANKLNEIWHIDLTVLRLLDGRRAYVDA